MDEEEDVLFQGPLHKLKLPKSGRFSRLGQERWKIKYFVLSCHGNQLLLKSYNKKPKHLHSSQPKKQISLSPSFKVEKLSNCHNRAFAVQLTAPNCQLFVSADEQSTMDMFVFLMQTQIRLRDTIQDNLVGVKTDLSDAFARIGAKGANCILHTSPWGLTLILKQSRVVLAQWPLKSIRYYESSGQGQFMIEAGMVAPMGQGVFQFHTLPGLDNHLYDTVDHYVINTLDRVKPNQRGTPEEIQDYIREFDCLHSLTMLTPTPLTGNEEVTRVLRDNWNIPSQISGAAGSSESRESQTSSVSGPPDVVPRLSSSESAPAGLHSVLPPLPPASASSPLLSNNSNLHRPLPTPHSPSQDRQRQSPYSQRGSPRHRGSPAPVEKGRVSGRPPPPPPRNSPQGSARHAKTSTQSSRQDFVDGVSSPRGSVGEPRRHSNPANVALRVTHDTDSQPAVRKQLSYDSGTVGMLDKSLSHAAGSPRSPRTTSARNSAEHRTHPVGSTSHQMSVESTPDNNEHKLDGPVEDWLVSASCEDLSDHMRTVIFEKRDKHQAIDCVAEEEQTNSYNPDFIPPPFTNIVDFRPNMDSDRGRARDRSQSFDVNSKMHKNAQLRGGAGAESPGLSIKQIRKMVSARTITKETLRKSLSNPNFLNLGSKEKLYQHRLQVTKSSHIEREEAPSAKLSAQTKAKSRSLANLLPNSLRRYLSKESLATHPHPPSSSSPSPEIRHRRQHNSRAMAADSEGGDFQRQLSARSLKEMSVKGIHFTEHSRSFRRPKGTVRSKSAEPGDRNHIKEDNYLLQDHAAEVQHARSASTEIERDTQYIEINSHKEGEDGQTIYHNGCEKKTGHLSHNGSEAERRPKSDTRQAELSHVRNGVFTQSADLEWKIRLPSRTTSQTSC